MREIPPPQQQHWVVRNLDTSIRYPSSMTSWSCELFIRWIWFFDLLILVKRILLSLIIVSIHTMLVQAQSSWADTFFDDTVNVDEVWTNIVVEVMVVVVVIAASSVTAAITSKALLPIHRIGILLILIFPDCCDKTTSIVWLLPSQFKLNSIAAIVKIILLWFCITLMIFTTVSDRVR